MPLATNMAWQDVTSAAELSALKLLLLHIDPCTLKTQPSPNSLNHHQPLAPLAPKHQILNTNKI